MKRTLATIYTDRKNYRCPESDTLFARGLYKTKIKILPENYLKLWLGWFNIYIDVIRIKCLSYTPNNITNHMFKDDFLKIIFKDDNNTVIWGNSIVTLINKIRKLNLNVNTKDIIENIRKKRLWLKNTYPETYEDIVGNKTEKNWFI